MSPFTKSGFGLSVVKKKLINNYGRFFFKFFNRSDLILLFFYMKN